MLRDVTQKYMSPGSGWDSVGDGRIVWETQKLGKAGGLEESEQS